MSVRADRGHKGASSTHIEGSNEGSAGSLAGPEAIWTQGANWLAAAAPVQVHRWRVHGAVLRIVPLRAQHSKADADSRQPLTAVDAVARHPPAKACAQAADKHDAEGEGHHQRCTFPQQKTFSQMGHGHPAAQGCGLHRQARTQRQLASRSRA